jgi:Zn finger protein HypA/HybF involved in hydrogenase expression
MVWEIVGPSDIAHKAEIAEEMHEFCMLAEVLDLVSQAAANNEALLMAQELVSNGSARWKDEMNVEKARAAINSCQNEKNGLRLKEMFGSQRQSLL